MAMGVKAILLLGGKRLIVSRPADRLRPTAAHKDAAKVWQIECRASIARTKRGSDCGEQGRVSRATIGGKELTSVIQG